MSAAAPGRILVTGAGGFVGRHLLPALRQHFPAATLVAASRRGDVAGADETVPFDLLAPGLEDSLRRIAPDAVLHLAAQASVPVSFADPAGTWRVNLDGSLALGEAMLRALPGRRFVHVSSAEIYGLSFQAGTPLAEDALPRPANPYAASKAAADLAIGELSLRGLNAVRLRPFNQTGPGQSDGFVVPAFAKQVALIEAGKQEPLLRTGALDRWRDFIDVRDVCAAYALALAAPSLPPGAVFNLSTGRPQRVGDILDALLARAGIAARVEQDAGRLRPTDVERTAGDARAAREALGWEPSTPWAQTLDDVLQDWRGRVAAG
ncbi:GDP-mannose 4,6-dehydratase [Roseomonas sp. BN140053]|uniref:GDP-mannose 4,6-dehydratase n=1 Tax=Roseomonas sp. BN140053 TaxID=3391898 RepID=UPI0039ED54C5